MRLLFSILILSIALFSCTSSPGNKFKVTGTISNSKAKMVYLEKAPAVSAQPMIVDSVALPANGKFSLTADEGESVVYNIRLDRNQFPVASVINDAKEIKLDIAMHANSSEFPDKYEVEGSPASLQMKEFLFRINNDLQKIFIIASRADSMKNAMTPDSLVYPVLAEQNVVATSVKKFVEKSLSESPDPALTVFELGYYQSTANNPRFGLQPFNDEQVQGILEQTSAKYPSHKGTAAIIEVLAAEMNKQSATSWVGKAAPDFSMPDVTGKQVSLSSFKGKYVLVDFWASWCGPCRAENPNLVKAYNQFKDKNFTVLGVSLDRPGQKDKWLKAISDDQLSWTNISDLQWWSSPVVSLYGFDGIPFNILLDPQGKVIAEGLRGARLEQKLSQVLQ